MSRAIHHYESPYLLKLGEDIWDAYDRLKAADMPRAFEIQLPGGDKVNLATLEVQAIVERAEG